MKMTGRPIHFATGEEWRTWLETNHATGEAVWLMIYKKHARTPSVTLLEAMQEAICFGWIDSSMQPIDEERYALRFTPRRKNERLVRAQQGMGRDADRTRTDDRGRPRQDRGGLRGPDGPVVQLRGGERLQILAIDHGLKYPLWDDALGVSAGRNPSHP